ncbi:MAG TPA: ABC transporter permease [Chthoniobacterales bacterium]
MQPRPKRILLPFTTFIAWRYLRPKRTFLSLITLISIFGVVLGISVLIIVISVMTGFERELQRRVVGFQSHLLVRNEGGLLKDWRPLLAQVEKVPGVVAVAPVMQGRAVVEFQNRRLTPYLIGIDPDLQRRVTDFEQYLVAGKFDLGGDTCVIGAELASLLGATVGDTLTIYSPHLNEVLDLLKKAQDTKDNHALLDQVHDMLLPQQLEITGIFNAGRYAYDSDYIIVPLHIGQEAYSLGDAVHALEVKTTDPFKVDQVKGRIEPLLPPPIAAATWIDDNREIFEAIRTERTTMFFVLIFVVIVAAFGIMSTLITTTVQKTREIGVMKALGAQVHQILWIFLAQGVIVGFFGTLLGLGTGIALVQYRNQVREMLASALHIQLFPASVYQFSEIPAEIVPTDVAIICASGFFICAMAALVPAYFASRLDPVKALRFD